MPTLARTRSLSLFGAALAAAACSATTHAARPASIGTPTSAEAMEALLDRPGPIEVETVVGADWAVTRAGLINLEDPTAKAAGLRDGDEPIQIYTHVVRHPTRGTFLIDTGASWSTIRPDWASAGWFENTSTPSASTSGPTRRRCSAGCPRWPACC